MVDTKYVLDGRLLDSLSTDRGRAVAIVAALGKGLSVDPAYTERLADEIKKADWHRNGFLAECQGDIKDAARWYELPGKLAYQALVSQRSRNISDTRDLREAAAAWEAVGFFSKAYEFARRKKDTRVARVYRELSYLLE